MRLDKTIFTLALIQLLLLLFIVFSKSDNEPIQNYQTELISAFYEWTNIPMNCGKDTAIVINSNESTIIITYENNIADIQLKIWSKKF